MSQRHITRVSKRVGELTGFGFVGLSLGTLKPSGRSKHSPRTTFSSTIWMRSRRLVCWMPCIRCKLRWGKWTSIRETWVTTFMLLSLAYYTVTFAHLNPLQDAICGAQTTHCYMRRTVSSMANWFRSAHQRHHLENLCWCMVTLVLYPLSRLSLPCSDALTASCSG
jgi:hypothetical protein